MPNDIYHHGTKGQKWYRRRYQNPDGSLTPLGRIHYGIKGTRVKKRDNARPKNEHPSNVNKKKNVNVQKENVDVKKENPVADDLADRWSRRKQQKYIDAIRSGNKHKIRRAEKHLTNEELKEAIDRIDLNYKLNNMKKQNKAEDIKRAKDNVQNLATLAGQGVNIYNVIAGLSEVLPGGLNLPKIDVKAKDPLDRQKKEIALETEKLKRYKAQMEVEEKEADHDSVMEEKDREKQQRAEKWKSEDSKKAEKTDNNVQPTKPADDEPSEKLSKEEKTAYNDLDNIDFDNIKYDKDKAKKYNEKATEAAKAAAETEQALADYEFLKEMSKRNDIDFSMNIEDDSLDSLSDLADVQRAKATTYEALDNLYKEKGSSYSDYKKVNKQQINNVDQEISDAESTIRRLGKIINSTSEFDKTHYYDDKGDFSEKYAQYAQAKSMIGPEVSRLNSLKEQRNRIIKQNNKTTFEDKRNREIDRMISAFKENKIKANTMSDKGTSKIIKSLQKNKGLIAELRRAVIRPQYRKNADGSRTLIPGTGIVDWDSLSDEALNFYRAHSNDVDLDDLLQSMFSVNIYEALER